MDEIISQRIQDYFVLLCIVDDKFLGTAQMSIKPKYFSSEVSENIITLCYTYYLQFNKAPGNHFHDELVRYLSNKSQDDKELYLSYVKRLHEMELPNRDYVISRINKFVRAREFTSSAIEFVRLTEKGKFEEAEQLMMKALKMGVSKENVGLIYFDNLVPTYYFSDKGQSIMPLKIEALDNRVEIRRRQLIVILGNHKGKKSWFCMHLAKDALLEGHNVLHISHEMTEEEIELRYDMMFGSLTSKRGTTEVLIKEYSPDGDFISAKPFLAQSVYNEEVVKKTRKITKKLCGKLIIKKYPMGSCSMGEMERYMDYLEVFHNFVPDVVINDYPDIMKLSLTDSVATRDRLNQTYMDLKRICDERNIAIIVPSQTNRAATEMKKITKKDFAEDIRKLGNVDLAIGLSADTKMAEDGILRVWILAGRSDEDNFGCNVSTNIKVGQVVMQSWIPRDREEESKSKKGN